MGDSFFFTLSDELTYDGLEVYNDEGLQILGPTRLANTIATHDVPLHYPTEMTLAAFEQIALDGDLNRQLVEDRGLFRAARVLLKRRVFEATELRSATARIRLPGNFEGWIRLYKPGLSAQHTTVRRSSRFPYPTRYFARRSDGEIIRIVDLDVWAEQLIYEDATGARQIASIDGYEPVYRPVWQVTGALATLFLSPSTQSTRVGTVAVGTRVMETGRASAEMRFWVDTPGGWLVARDDTEPVQPERLRFIGK